MSYQTTVPSKSSTPQLSATWASLGDCMIQKALMCGKLSSISRLTANVRRSSSPLGPGRELSALPSGMNESGMQQLNAALGEARPVPRSPFPVPSGSSLLLNDTS